MIEFVKVVRAAALDGRRLTLAFSNGTTGVFDATDLVRSGSVMTAPLADPDYFARVFVQNGVPTWPNGFDLDAIALHQDLKDAGLLTQAAIEAA
jgi:hypothetical protein